MREIDGRAGTVNAGRWRMAVKTKLCNMVPCSMTMEGGNWERGAYQNAGDKIGDVRK